MTKVVATRSGVRGGLIALILLLIGVLVVLVIGLAPLMDLPARSEPDAVRQEATSSASLDDAYSRARARAGEWAIDAVLVRVEASWYAAANWQDLAVPPLAWGFLFYSPGEGALVTIVVDDAELLWVPPLSLPVVPAAVETFPPAYTPELVWVTFLAAGGDEFLRNHPQAQVTFRLQPGEERLMWVVSAFQGDAHVAASIDAESGVVMPTQVE